MITVACPKCGRDSRISWAQFILSFYQCTSCGHLIDLAPEKVSSSSETQAFRRTPPSVDVSGLVSIDASRRGVTPCSAASLNDESAKGKTP